MATVNVRKETGRLYIDFRHRGIRCREQTPLKNTISNRRQLEKLIEKMNAEITLGVFNYGKTFPYSQKLKLFSNSNNEQGENKRFAKFAQEWITEMSPNWRRSYLKTVEYLVQSKLLNKFGQYFINDISKSDILMYRSELVSAKTDPDGASCLSARYVNRVIGLLSSIITEASERYNFQNPTTVIKPLNVRKKAVLPFALNEVESIINNAPAEFTDYFIVRFFTGLRTGELHALRWQNIRFDDRQIYINESIIDGIVGDTKSASSDRVIYMTDQVLSALKRLFQTSGRGKYVFTRNGQPLTQSYVTQSVWYPLLNKLKLLKRRPYETRHTAATLWMASGENPEWIAYQLGHSNTQILFETYSNYVPNLTRSDGRAANKLFNQVRVLGLLA
jgi:integrase